MALFWQVSLNLNASILAILKLSARTLMRAFWVALCVRENTFDNVRGSFPNWLFVWVLSARQRLPQLN